MSVVARITPAVLRWARESIGFESEQSAQKISFSPTKMDDIENGRDNISIAKLRDLAKYYKRPIATFFLSEPPKTRSLPKDFRTLPEDVKLPLSPKSLILIRKAMQMQKDASEFAIDLGISPSLFSKVSVSDDVEKESITFRKTISVEEQFKWHNQSEAFLHWRNFVEEQNVLVFQLPLSKDEVRGFTIYEEGLPTIVISSKDTINAKIFTLFHEYAHILIGREGMCLPDYAYEGRMEIGEKFCNRFAGAFLVPKDALLSFYHNNLSIDEFKNLSKKFKVSRYVILKRFHELKKISFEQYQVFYKQMRKDEKPILPFGRATWAGRCVSERGKRYVSMIFEAKAKGLISLGEMPRYLGVKTKYFAEVAAIAKMNNRKEG